MPYIQQTIRISFGQHAAPIAQVIATAVDQISEYTLSVQGVPSEPLSPPRKAGAKSKSKPKKAQMKYQVATFKPPVSNVEFVAIYDAGEGSGLHLGVGKSKPALLKEPLILTGAAARAFGKNPVVQLENHLPIARTLAMIIGSNLDKADRKMELKTQSGK